MIHFGSKRGLRGEFDCGAKRKCGEMVSCEEARFYLEECGFARLDRDGDDRLPSTKPFERILRVMGVSVIYNAAITAANDQYPFGDDPVIG